jgi:hypothetical protein
LGAATAELQHVFVAHVAEHLELGLGQVPEAPAEERQVEKRRVLALVLGTPGIPACAAAPDVLGGEIVVGWHRAIVAGTVGRLKLPRPDEG